MASLRSLYRSSSSLRSYLHSAVLGSRILNDPISLRTLFTLSHTSPSSPLKNAHLFSDCRSPFGMTIGSIRTFSQDVAHLPDIKDPEIENVFKDFMAVDWSDLPESLVNHALKVLSKPTDDTEGKNALMNVVRAAEAVEEFTGTLETLRMKLDDSTGMSGENVKELPEVVSSALRTAYSRYTDYMNAFGPEETYLKRKVETQLGTRMIHLKMRCGGLGSEWGKVTVLGTSGLSGSYVEQRGP